MLSPLEATGAITVLANMMAAQLSDEDLEMLAVYISLLGDMLEAIAFQRTLSHEHRKEQEHAGDTAQNER